MVGINFVILIVVAIIASLINPEYDGFLDAFARGSIKWMITPNSILYIDHPQTLFLAGVVVVIEIVLFSGVIIALTTNAIKDYFAKKNASGGKIYLEDHIVVLNWNSKVPELVSDLLFADEVDTTVVIMADIEKNYAEKMIRNVVSRKKYDSENLQKLSVIVKKGDPLLKTELSDVSIEHAKAIIIMSENDSMEMTNVEISQSDLYAIKVLLSVGSVSTKKNTATIVEVKDIKTKTIIVEMATTVDTLYNLRVIPVCFDKRLGQIIAQTAISSEIEKVYLSLFSFAGSEVYEANRQSVEDYLLTHSHGVPVFKGNDTLYVVAEKESHAAIIRKNPYRTEKRLKMNEPIPFLDTNIVIIGKNNKQRYVMDSFIEYEKISGNHFRAEVIEQDQIDKMFSKINESDEDFKVLILSDDTAKQDSYDANVILTLLKAHSKIKRKGVQIIAEILDPKNDGIIKDFNIDNTIISNKIISLLLSKLALFPSTGPFYDELLTISADKDTGDRCSILIRPCSDLFQETFPLRFSSLTELVQTVYFSLDKKYVVFGMFKEGALNIFGGDLDKTNPFSLDEKDQLVLLRV